MAKHSSTIDRRFADAIEASVQSYFTKIWFDPKAKDEAIDASVWQYLPSEKKIVATLRELSRVQRSIFGMFSYAKHALDLLTRKGFFPAISDLIPFWLHCCVRAGAFKDCLCFGKGCMASEAWTRNMRARESLSVLSSRGKSLRNTGKLDLAQECYRQFLEMADERDEPTEVSIGLLLIGKLYGNYLGQRSLFSSFVEEARARLESELSSLSFSDAERYRYMTNLAICYDALGQAYRGIERKKAEEYFSKAIELNEQIGRQNGASRAWCHLNYFKFYNASPDERPAFLQAFYDKGIRDNSDEGGFGIRYTQYAAMLLEMNDLSKARNYLASGKNFAERYSEYKTMARAAVVKADLFKTSDPERAIEYLKKASALARQYKLPIEESDINRRLAGLLSSGAHINLGDTEAQAPQLFNNNREIFMKLISEVKGSLAQLDSSEGMKPEFKKLSPEVRTSFREKLLLDFIYTVNELDRNIRDLIAALSLNERHRQELVFLDVADSIARLLWHDFQGTLISRHALTTLEGVAARIEKSAGSLREASTLPESAAWPRSLIKKVSRSLRLEVKRIRNHAEDLSRLQVLLRDRLRRPESEDLQEKVSLYLACKKAIEEFRQQNAYVASVVSFQPTCDIKILCNNDIVVIMIKELIRNAVKALRENELPEARVIVLLTLELRRSKRGDLAVLTQLADTDRVKALAASLRNGLDHRVSVRQQDNLSTRKRARNGIGLDFAKLVFKDFLGADISVLQDKQQAGIHVSFPSVIIEVDDLFDHKGS